MVGGDEKVVWMKGVFGVISKGYMTIKTFLDYWIDG